jgi:hypothetical protein
VKRRITQELLSNSRSLDEKSYIEFVSHTYAAVHLYAFVTHEEKNLGELGLGHAS